MDTEKILQQIRAGLTGEAEHDMAYLQQQGDAYKDHPQAKEILREVGRLMYDIMPEETKQQLQQATQRDLQQYADALGEVRACMQNKDLQTALTKIEELAGKLSEAEESGMFQNDSQSAYFTFDELFEEVLYRETHQGGPEVRGAGIPFGAVYYHYGSLLIELKRYEDAKKMLEKAVRWNPGSAMFAFEYAETFKMLGQMEDFRRITLQTFQIAFRPMTLARCYRNMAYAFSAARQWDAAAACCWVSLQFDSESPAAQEELAYIEHESGETPQPPTLQQLRELAEKYDFPLSADQTVLGLAYGCAQQCVQQNYTDMAIYFLQIVYDLTHNREVQQQLEQLQPKQK